MKAHLGSAIIAIAIVVSVIILGSAYTYKFKSNETISVTGLAEKNFISDRIVWSGSYSRKTMDLKEAYQQLKNDEQSIRKYLTDKGIAKDELVFSSVDIQKDYKEKYTPEGKNIGTEFSGYILSQSLTVDSKHIDRVEKISREVTELIQTGIEFNSGSPSYFYTKLAELKLDLLAKASADAKQRALTIAKNSGSSRGRVQNANMGVFQITGQNSNEDYSYGGSFNTSSKNKTASITIRSDYELE